MEYTLQLLTLVDESVFASVSRNLQTEFIVYIERIAALTTGMPCIFSLVLWNGNSYYALTMSRDCVADSCRLPSGAAQQGSYAPP